MAATATLMLTVGAAADRPVPSRPEIHFAEGVPDDLRALATATWGRFLGVFPARSGCLADVTVKGAWELENRARYEPDLRRVTIRIPGTAPNLRATLVHEFAHHVEFTCQEQRRFRPRFLAAQGLPLSAPWFRGAGWERIPSEQFAEATVRAVVGRASLPLVVVRPEAVEAIGRWGRGG